MNGMHDLGGMMGFGPIDPEVDEPVFHQAWERRIFAMTLAMGALGKWNIDMSRHARERVPPQQYINASYYQIWLAGIKRLMTEQGLVNMSEITQGISQHGPMTGLSVLKAENVAGVLARGAPAARETTTGACFKPGQKIRTKNINPAGHTRLARYLRGHVGEIVKIHGNHVLPDSNAHGRDENPQWLYGVRFMAQELWGEGASPQDSVYADLWETYLEPV